MVMWRQSEVCGVNLKFSILQSELKNSIIEANDGQKKLGSVRRRCGEGEVMVRGGVCEEEV